MLSSISLLTTFIFAVLYPLCFWISAHDPLKNKFHRFHLGLPCILAGIIAVFILPSIEFTISIKILTSVWLLLLLIITAYYWSKETPNPILITVAVLAGLAAFIQAQNIILKTGWEAALASILAGGIFVASMFAMNLGHWYLNVHGLPVSHLFRATYVFWALVAIRFLWDIYYILTANVLYRGEPFPLVQFIQKTDGILILLGIFFGVLFPLGGNYFVKETLKLKNTQSATGILYVILVAVILGDLAFKYYLIKFGIAL